MRAPFHLREAMMDVPKTTSPDVARRWLLGPALGLWLAAGAATGAVAAEASYPFEGTWILPQHPCVADSQHLRTYTAREVTSARGRCSIRRVAQGAGVFELMEECRRDGRVSTVTETIRIATPDTMLLRRQLVRLKIPRQLRYMRCNVAATAVRPAGRTTVPVH